MSAHAIRKREPGLPYSFKVMRRRWSSNSSGKCTYERPTRCTVCGTMRSMCGADAGRLAINYHSLKLMKMASDGDLLARLQHEDLI